MRVPTLDQPDFAPVWGLAPCVRSLLEAAGRAVCLASPRLKARGRVECYMNERLYALDQVAKLPAGARDSVAVVEQRREIIDSAIRGSFSRQPHHLPAKEALGKLADPPQLGTGRVSDTEAVRRLFEAMPDLGKGAFQWFSASAHATAWEVEKPFRTTATNALGISSVELGRDPREVFQVFSAAVLGYIEMATRFLMFWGVRDVDWSKASLNAIRIRSRVGEVVGRGPKP